VGILIECHDFVFYSYTWIDNTVVGTPDVAWIIRIDVLHELGQLSVNCTSTVRQRKKLCLPRHWCGCVLKLCTSVGRQRHGVVFDGHGCPRRRPAVCTEWRREWLADISQSLVRHFRRRFECDDSAVSVKEVHILAAAWVFSSVCMDELMGPEFFIVMLIRMSRPNGTMRTVVVIYQLLCWNCCPFCLKYLSGVADP